MASRQLSSDAGFMLTVRIWAATHGIEFLRCEPCRASDLLGHQFVFAHGAQGELSIAFQVSGALLDDAPDSVRLLFWEYATEQLKFLRQQRGLAA